MHIHDRILLPYKDAKLLLQEADVLLFRGNAWYSFLIQKAGWSEYSHVGMISRHNGPDSDIELVEFHGYKGGGATTNFDNSFPEFSGQIDVYRPVSWYRKQSFNKNTQQVEEETILLDRKAITKTMRSLTGLPYGWRRIWWMTKKQLFGLRLFYNTEDLTSDEIESIIYPVCSTAVAYSFAKNNYDLLKERSDQWMRPGDIANSPLLNYLFTIG